jgi:hypothetical protein
MKMPTAKQQRALSLATTMAEEAKVTGNLVYVERVCLSQGMKGAILEIASRLAYAKAREYQETSQELCKLYQDRAIVFYQTKKEMEAEGLIKTY